MFFIGTAGPGARTPYLMTADKTEPQGRLDRSRGFPSGLATTPSFQPRGCWGGPHTHARVLNPSP